MNDIMKIVQALEHSNILVKGVTIKNETKELKGGFLSMLLDTLGASLLGNLLTGKGIVRAGSGNPSSSAPQNKKVKGIVRAGSGNGKGKRIVTAGTGLCSLNSFTSYRPSSSASQNKKEWDF